MIYYCDDSAAVVLNGREVIHEAFVKRAADFSDRPWFYANQGIFNPNCNGNPSSDCLFMLSLF